MVKVNVGPGPHNAKGWVNLDVVETEDIQPDVLYDGKTLPFEDEYVDVFYVAHILEHIVWEEVPEFIEELYRVLKSEGKMIVLGPDLYRALDLFKRGKIPLSELKTFLEWPHLENWDAPRHYWNCYEDRVVELFDGKWLVERVPIESKKLDEYPVVSRAPWQMSLIVTKK